MATTYRRYLTRSTRWAAFRTRVHARAGRKCEHCHTTATLEIHHTRYRLRRSDLRLRDVMAVCKRCHLAAHGRWAEIAELEEAALRRGVTWPPMPTTPPPAPTRDPGAVGWDDLEMGEPQPEVANVR